MIWWILLAILIFILILPLGVRVNYDEDGTVVSVMAGPLRFQVFPVKKKDKPKKKKEEPKQEQPKEEAVPEPEEPQPKSTVIDDDDDEDEEPEPPAEKKGGNLTDFLPLVELALKFVGEFFGKTLHIDVLYLKLTMAGGDPADLAINYGKTWIAVGNFLPVLERWFVIKHRDVEVECDFTASETKVIVRAEITITLGRLLSLAAVYAVRGIKEFIVFRNKRKGGASQ